MQAVHPRVSYADMERWPEDGRRYELYDGEVFEIPSPLPIYQMVLARLYLALQGHVSSHGGIVLFAPLDIVLTEYDLVEPDLLLFTSERQHLIDPKKVTRNPPDLAVEILSPGTETNDRGRKLRLLARHTVFGNAGSSIPRMRVSRSTVSRAIASRSFTQREMARRFGLRFFPTFTFARTICCRKAL